MQQHCSVEDCENAVNNKKHGWCRKHYLRWYKHGTVHHYSRFDVRKPIFKDGYALIPLDKDGKRYVKVDTDAPVFDTNWCFDGEYAVKRHNGRVESMHRLLMAKDITDGMQVDHINRDKLDNRRCNLRVVTRSLNQINKVMKNNKSGYRGVSWDKRDGKWTAVVALNKVKKIIYWGDSFDNAVDARKNWEADHGITPVS